LRAHERIYQANKDSEANTNKAKGKIEAFVTKTTCPDSEANTNKAKGKIEAFVSRHVKTK